MADELTISILHRAGDNSKKERYSVDFLINGESLFRLIHPTDMCGRFSKETPDWNRKSANVFKLSTPADLEGNRVMLFVCPECGDLKCGAITFTLTGDASSVCWSDFAFENGYDDSMRDFNTYKEIGPFKFERRKYEKVIDEAANT